MGEDNGACVYNWCTHCSARIPDQDVTRLWFTMFHIDAENKRCGPVEKYILLGGTVFLPKEHHDSKEAA